MFISQYFCLYPISSVYNPVLLFITQYFCLYPSTSVSPVSIILPMFRVYFHFNTSVNRRRRGRSLANFTHSNALLDIRQGTGKCFCVFLVFKHSSDSLTFTADRCRDLPLNRISWRELQSGSASNWLFKFWCANSLENINTFLVYKCRNILDQLCNTQLCQTL